MENELAIVVQESSPKVPDKKQVKKMNNPTVNQKSDRVTLIQAIPGMLIGIEDVQDRYPISSFTMKCRSNTGIVYFWKASDFRKFCEKCH